MKTVWVRILEVVLLTIVCDLGLAWAQTSYSIQLLHDFETNWPSSLISAPDGRFYGSTHRTTFNGTRSSGTVFRANLHGTIVTLVSFPSPVGDDPGGLTLGNDGQLYGIMTFGSGGDGSVFAIAPDNTVTVLHVFNGADGARPFGKLLLATDGNLYDSTAFGGPNNAGTVFRISPPGSTFSNLYSFSDTTGWQAGGLLETADGWLYGSTSLGANQIIFKINFAGDLQTVTNLTQSTGFGLLPLILMRDGSIWGPASSGGAYNRGTIVKLSTNDLLSVVTSFGQKDGSEPRGLIEGIDGNLYGVTFYGGKHGLGTMFKVTPQGELGTIADFDGNAGAYPAGPLALGTDGNIYGVASSGGRFGNGTLFRLVRTPEISISRIGAGTNLVTWTCFAAGDYRLENKAHLSDTNWQVAGEITTPSGGTTVTNLLSGQSQGFFRVVALP